MKNSIIIIFLFLFASCTNGDKKTTRAREENKTSKVKDLQKNKKQISIKTSLPSEKTLIPEIFLFKHSECGGNCGNTEQVIFENKKTKQLFLKFGTIKNCIGKFKHEINIENDVLNIEIRVKGNVSLECECYFNFEIGIQNVNHPFKHIFVNGEKIINGQIVKNRFEVENIIDTIIK